MIVEGLSGRYTLGTQVAETEKYRLYLCREESTGQECLLQIATDNQHDGTLCRSAVRLEVLKRAADALEAEYEKVRENPEMRLNYAIGFPELIDSFPCIPQGSRQINILAFRNVEDVRHMVPLCNITVRDHLRVDFRTSAWIMGKLLKLLVFAHSQGIAVGRLDSANILIEPKQHYVLFFDWSEAFVYPETVPTEIARQEIAQAANAVITVVGGNLETRTFPDDGDTAQDRYTDFLLQLADGRQRDAQQAHTEFYKLVDELWKREYYEFTTLPVHT